MLPEEIIAQESESKHLCENIGFTPSSRFMELGADFKAVDYRAMAHQLGFPKSDVALIRDEDLFPDFPEVCRAIISRRSTLS